MKYPYTLYKYICVITIIIMIRVNLAVWPFDWEISKQKISVQHDPLDPVTTSCYFKLSKQQAE